MVFLKKVSVFLLLLFVFSISIYLLQDTYIAIPESTQPAQNKRLGLSFENSLGQSFISNTNRFSSITLYGIYDRDPGFHDDYVTIHLRHFPGDKEDIATIRKSTFVWRFSPQLTIRFPEQIDAPGSVYYILIQSESDPGRISLYASPGDYYRYGTAYQSGIPIDNDLAFAIYTKLSIDKTLDLVWSSKTRFCAFFLLFFFISLSGILTTNLLCDLSYYTWTEKTILGFSAGLCFPIILLLGFSFFNIPANWQSLFLALLIVLLLSIVNIWHNKKKKNPQNNTFSFFSLSKLNVPSPSAETITISLLFVLATIIRILQISSIQVPNWFDGFFHNYVLQEISTAGKIPLDLNYPAGFHAIAYISSLFLRSDPPETLILCGQMISAFSGLTFYLLSRKILKTPLGRIAAVSFYWFFSPFPAYLTSWSRFPILLGITLFPAACYSLIDFFQRKTSNYFYILWIMVGIVFSNYSILIFFFCLIPVLFFIFSNRKKAYLRKHEWKSILFIIFPIVVILGAKLLQLVLTNEWSTLIQQTRSNAFKTDLINLIWLTFQRGGALVWLVGAAGLVSSYFRYRKFFYTVIIWLLVIFIVLSLQYLLLSASISTLSNVLIFLSLPLSFSGGIFIELVVTHVNRLADSINPCAFFCFLFLTYSSAINQIGILNPVTQLFTSSDMSAIESIQTNIDKNEKILINSYLWNGTYQPADGGGWITTFTGNPTINYNRNVDKSFDKLINKERIRYIYQGNGYSRISDDQLRNFEPIFEKNNVTIYRLKDR